VIWRSNGNTGGKPGQARFGSPPLCESRPAAGVGINTASRLLRVAAAGMTLVMSWAIVASANHLFVDMALGGFVVAVSWFLVRQLDPANDRG